MIPRVLSKPSLDGVEFKSLPGFKHIARIIGKPCFIYEMIGGEEILYFIDYNIIYWIKFQ